MDFEPRDSRLVTFGKRAAAVCAVLLFALVLFFESSFGSRYRFPFSRATLSLPHSVKSLAEAYPFAVKLKDRKSPEAQFEMASAFLKREGDHFEIPMLNLYFVSRTGKGRMVMVGILNERRQAYVNDVPLPQPKGVSEPGDLTALLVPPPIDLPQLIEAAGTNGFNEFVARTGDGCYVSATLMSTTNRPFWKLTAFDLKNMESAREFSVTIDARTGVVMPDPFPNSVRHHDLK